MVKTLQGLGYFVSTLSVLLLGAVAWQTASEDRTLFAALIAGTAGSVIGMLLRWLSFLEDQRQKEASKEPPGRSARGDRGFGSGRAAGTSVPSRS